MRILSFFFKLVLLGGAVSAFIYFFGGLLWLKVGTYAFLRDVNHLPLYDSDISTYLQLCQQAPESSDNSTPYAFQLRFLDDRRYVVELVCTLIENSPIELKQGSLPPFITKVPGSAGFTYPIEQQEPVTSAIVLFSVNKHMGVQLQGDTVTTGPEIESLVGTYPKSMCVSFGYQCCDSESQAGQGQLLSRSVTDCPTRCFPACGSLPFVELFNSDPPYEQTSREIAMTTNTMDVIFNYGVNPKTAKNVHIEYGDGKTQDSSLVDGIFTHTYLCTGACTFTVKLTVTDENGVSSVENSQSTIYIVKK